MLALIACAAIAAAPLADRFAGGFIQLNVSTANDPSSRLDRKKWGDVLAAMKDAGMTTVILQQLAYRDGGRDYDVLRPGEPDDALEAILAEAEARGMAVFVGLWNAVFDASQLKTDVFLDEATARSAALLAKIRAHPEYLRYTSFCGWYLPIEPWNYREMAGETERLRRHYLVPLSKQCRDLCGKPVGLSCHFNPDATQYATPEQARGVYTELLKGRVIDILFPQDGVGEKGHKAADCQAYLKAFRQACDAAGVKLWAVLECFTLGIDGVRFPARPARLPFQFNNAHGIADSFVTYDFFHYMNPNRYTWASGEEIDTLCAGGCAACRKCLYDGYRKLIGPAP